MNFHLGLSTFEVGKQTIKNTVIYLIEKQTSFKHYAYEHSFNVSADNISFIVLHEMWNKWRRMPNMNNSFAQIYAAVNAIVMTNFDLSYAGRSNI